MVEVHLKFCRPARLEDELVIVSQLEKIRAATCIICQKILRRQDTIADATVTAAFLNSSGRPSRQPSEWVAKFEAVRGRTA